MTELLPMHDSSGDRREPWSESPGESMIHRNLNGSGLNPPRNSSLLPSAPAAFCLSFSISSSSCSCSIIFEFVLQNYMFYYSAGLIIIASLLFHVSQKSISGTANPIFSLIITYLVALIISLGIFWFYPHKLSLTEYAKQLNWGTFGVAIAIVGMEIGFLLAYRCGWSISLGPVIINGLVAMLLVGIETYFFKRHISLINLFGILFSTIGLLLVNSK